MGPTIRQGTIDDLRELLRAIDRRLPRVTHTNEPAIAEQASALRDQAFVLLARLEALEVDGTREKPVSQRNPAQTSGQHDQKDNRGSAGQEAEGDIRYQRGQQRLPSETAHEAGSERLKKSGRKKRLL